MSPTKKNLDAAAEIAQADKPGDYFVCEGNLYRVADEGGNKRTYYLCDIPPGIDIGALLADLKQKRSPERRLGQILGLAAEAARERWGAGETFEPFSRVVVEGRVYELGRGEHPCSRSDNRHYVKVGNHFVGFHGHRYPWSVKITERNYMKESSLSGDDIRQSCSVELYIVIADLHGPREKLVYTYGARTADYASRRLPTLMAQLMEHPGQLWEGGPDEFPKLQGRKVFWRNERGIIDHYIAQQGAVVIKNEDGKPFTPPVWRDKGDPFDDYGDTVKADLLDDNIWWFRK